MNSAGRTAVNNKEHLFTEPTAAAISLCILRSDSSGLSAAPLRGFQTLEGGLAQLLIDLSFNGFFFFFFFKDSLAEQTWRPPTQGIFYRTTQRHSQAGDK